MQNESKNTAMTGKEKKVKQKFTFAPQDGIDTPTVIEAETIEEAEQEFQNKIKNT
jgi:hypothetical protein